MTPRRVDVTRLPGDIVELIDSLAPGEDLLVTRDGTPIATISGMDSALDGVVTERDVTDGITEQPPRDDYDNVQVVATAMKLSTQARSSLSAALGADYIVLDLHSAPRTADVLLIPPASPQLVGNLRLQFPKARIIIIEIEDPGLGVSYTGPVRRMLAAGAEAYLTSTNIPSLAKQLDQAVTDPHSIAPRSGIRLEIEPPTPRTDPPS